MSEIFSVMGRCLSCNCSAYTSVYRKIHQYYPHTLGIIILCLFYIGFTSDFIITVLAIVKIRNRLILLDSISAEMKKISDRTGEKIFDGYEFMKEKKDEINEKNAANRQKLEALHCKYKAIHEKRSLTLNRFEKAFPKLKLESPKTFKEQLDDLKNQYKNYK